MYEMTTHRTIIQFLSIVCICVYFSVDFVYSLEYTKQQ